MTRSRLTLSVDKADKIFTLRYIGEIDGGDINDSMLTQLSQLERAWEYDTIVDMRRHDGTVMASEIEELGSRWALMAQRRDEGRLIAVISEDPLVHARLPVTQSAFPGRIVRSFMRLDEGLEWLHDQRGTTPRAIAV